MTTKIGPAIVDRRTVVAGMLAAGLTVAGHATARAQADPLPSWNEGAAKAAILDFIRRTTAPGGPDFVPVSERIATFDNDGTLWTEQPFYFQLAFALDRVKALAPTHPEWKTEQPFSAVISGDMKALMASGEPGLIEIMEITHAGMTTDEFAQTVIDWTRTARHPRFNRPYTDLVFKPMLELLSHLRQNGFKTFVVSGGGIEFMRPWMEQVYGIPPEQVVGSSGITQYKLQPDGTPVLVKEAKVEFVDDGPGKPVGINRFIGRKPIFAFGNSDGDQQMLEWTASGTGPRFMGLVHHTDAEREYAYDRASPVGKLDKALDEATKKGWTVADMKRDWKEIFPS
ncbi:HAD family hydrolase [Mesorhizobium sp. LjRoot246]|uniref:HAD family hydrolase n=1 Tax=Mesorhizobium sp. LjRoot246 TaxID=3342294 RepID=UPI003F50CE86